MLGHIMAQRQAFEAQQQAQQEAQQKAADEAKKVHSIVRDPQTGEVYSVSKYGDWRKLGGVSAKKQWEKQGKIWIGPDGKPMLDPEYDASLKDRRAVLGRAVNQTTYEGNQVADPFANIKTAADWAAKFPQMLGGVDSVPTDDLGTADVATADGMVDAMRGGVQSLGVQRVDNVL